MAHRSARTTRALGALLGGLAAVALAGPAAAQVPSALGYQGRVMMDGAPATGIVEVDFALFDAEQAGQSVWSEKQQIALTDGFYATFLGDAQALPAGLFDGRELFLEVTIGGEVLTPRQRIASVAYAHRAAVAHSVSGGKVEASSVVVNGKVVIDADGQLAEGARYRAGSGVAIDDSTNTISLATGCAAGEVLKWSGSAWACGAVAKAGSGLELDGATFSLLSTCAPGQVLEFGGNGWQCAEDDDTQVALAEGSGLSLEGGKLSLEVGCAPGQDLVFDGTAWGCATAGTVTEVKVAAPLAVADGSTLPTISLSKAGLDADGYLASGDFKTFSEKLGASTPAAGDLSGTLGAPTVARLQGQPVSSAAPADAQVLKWDGSAWTPAPDKDAGGTVTSVTASGPLSVTNGTSTPALSLAKADASQDGYLSSADWAAFNGKMAANATAGGDLTGNLPNPTVSRILGRPLAATAPSAGQALKWNGTAWEPAADANAGGTVTSVTASGPLSVTNGTSTPAISLSGVVGATHGGTGLSGPTAAGQFLRSSGAGTWAAAGLSASDVPSLSASYVDLSTSQTVAGTKTFSATIVGSVSGNAGTVTNGVYTSGSYADPAWVTSLAGSKISGAVASATSAGSFTGSLAGDVTGTQSATVVGALQGRAVSSTAPSALQHLAWNGSAWAPRHANTVAALSDAATISVDASRGNVFDVTLAGNRTMGNPTNLVAGQTYLFLVKQDSTGGRTLSWDTAYQFSPALTVTSAANALTAVLFVSDGTRLYSLGSYPQGSDAFPVAATVTFTPCGQTGQTGPSQTQCNSAYASNWLLSGKVTLSTGIQLWTVPATGTYRIAAAGAAGSSNSGYTGGRGAIATGDVYLTAGTQLRIIVGQTGTYAGSCDAGGGGGTFVVGPSGAIMVGGGGGGASSGFNGQNASTNNNGTSACGTGGTSGNGGGTASASYGGGCGGGGLTGNGGGSTSWGDCGGRSFGNGGAGGAAVYSGWVYGGFGGGAGGHGNCWIGGGGGGGYSGGGAGGYCPSYGGGGGGGSFTSGTNATVSISSSNAQGSVTIQRLN